MKTRAWWSRYVGCILSGADGVTLAAGVCASWDRYYTNYNKPQIEFSLTVWRAHIVLAIGRPRRKGPL